MVFLNTRRAVNKPDHKWMKRIMSQPSQRERLETRRKKERNRQRITRAGIGMIVVALLGILIWQLAKPAAGQAIAILPADHIEDGVEPGPYNSDPPTSGSHYAEGLDAGFYNLEDLEAIGQYPEGHLVHNLEHGYVILWYNCELLDEQACDRIKTEIQAVIERENSFKVIGFPRESIEAPLVLTSWGRLQTFSSFESNAVARFISRNRNQAPEPNAP
jgi:hypothetical protein